MNDFNNMNHFVIDDDDDDDDNSQAPDSARDTSGSGSLEKVVNNQNEP